MTLADPLDPQSHNLRCNLPRALPLGETISRRTSQVELTSSEWGRYRRQIVLEPIGPDGQKKLKAARVLIVGLGGLGSPALLYLAGAGVGTIGIIDGDLVDVSNLQRQVLYDTKNIQTSKVIQARERALALNPEISLQCFQEFLTPKNAEAIFSQFDLVIDGSDNFATRYLSSDLTCKLGIPYIYASISQFLGQLSVFYPPHGPCYRCLFPEPPPPDAVPNCAEAGILGTVAGILGTMQAHETLKLITGAGQPLIGKVMLFDALKMEWRTFELGSDPDCPGCGRDSQSRATDPDTMLSLSKQCDSLKPGVHMTKSHDCDGEITPRDLKSLLDNAGSSDQLPIVLDVRTLDERERFGAIPGSWHIALDELEQTISINVQTKNVDESSSEFGLHPVMRTLLTLLFEKSKENPRGYQSTSASDHGPILVIYCKTGPRSRRALEMICDFFQQKFPLKNPIDSQIPWLQKINILKGGFLSWMEQQHTFEPSNG